MQHFIAAIAFIFIFSSCSDNSRNNLAVLRATNESLERSNKAISFSTTILYHFLLDKLSNPGTAEVAKIWQPKAELIKALSKEISNYINELRVELINKAGVIKDKEVFNENNESAVNNLFGKQKKGDELFKKLLEYKEKMLQIDPEIYKVFGKNTMIVSGKLEGDKDKAEEFTNTYFKDVSTIAAIAMLSKFENNVTIMENEFVSFCNSQIFDHKSCGYEKVQALIAQSSSYVKAGEEIEITAGIAVFSATAKPIISINGKRISTAEDAVANYKFKASFVPGKHSVPVKIEYTKPDGTKGIASQNLEYTVAQ